MNFGRQIIGLQCKHRRNKYYLFADTTYLNEHQLVYNQNYTGFDILFYQQVLSGMQIYIYETWPAFPLLVYTKMEKYKTTPTILKVEFGNYQKHMT